MIFLAFFHVTFGSPVINNITARVTIMTAGGGLLKVRSSEMSDFVKHAMAASARAIPCARTLISF